jgi:hypothetical protein
MMHSRLAMLCALTYISLSMRLCIVHPAGDRTAAWVNVAMGTGRLRSVSKRRKDRAGLVYR